MQMDFFRCTIGDDLLGTVWCIQAISETLSSPKAKNGSCQNLLPFN